MSTDRFNRYVVLAQQFGARTALFQHAAARLLGLTATELECFRLVQHEGPLTASDLVRETGLTGASLSVIVDKLARMGFVSREQDRGDRRRWLLRADLASVARVDAVYAGHARRVDRLLARHSTAEFEIILRFLGELADELKATAAQLTEERDAQLENGKQPG